MGSVLRRAVTMLGVVGGVWLLAACDPTPTEHVVNSTADSVDAVPGDGVCETATEDECTLRAAVMEANVDPGPDRVVLAPGATYLLTLDGAGEDAAATGDLDLAHRLTIDGGDATIDGGGLDRVLHVLPGARVDVVGAHITGGAAPHGGGILNIGQLTVTGTRLEGNAATGTGGAVRTSADAASLTLDGVTVEDNEAHTAAGVLAASDTTITRSSITANTATSSGGGLRAVDDATVVVLSSTIDSNEAGNEGGGVDNRATTYLINTTLSGNQATVGGGISARGPLLAGYTTVTDNQADPGRGGGIAVLTNGSVELRASIVAANPGDDCDGTVATAGGNLDGDGTCLPAPATDDQPATDPLLGPLTDNGGPTATHLPAAESPAVDALTADSGTCTVAGFVNPLDQRDQPRPAGDRCDAGAVERPEPEPPEPLVVDTATDAPDAAPGDGTCATATGTCTLRAAIDEANANPGPDAIEFAPGVDPVLSRSGVREEANATGDLDVHDDLTIDGQDTTIDANGIDRVIDHHSGSLRLAGVTITGGDLDGEPQILPYVAYGAGIRSRAPLTVTSGTITGNTGPSIAWHPASAPVVVTRGGGIYASATVHLDDVHVVGNEATSGAALFLDSGGTAELSTVDISANTTYVKNAPIASPFRVENVGSAVHALAPLAISDSVIDHNVGSGIQTVDEVAVTRSTVAANAAGGLLAGDEQVHLTEVDLSANKGKGILANGPVALERSTVSQNSGDGIDAGGEQVHLTEVYLAANEGQGILANGPVVLERSTVFENTGDGIELSGPGAELDATLITVADNGGAQIRTDGVGATLLASTLRGSSVVIDGVAPTTLVGTAVERATPGAACAASVQSSSWSMASDESCGLTGVGDVQGIALLLGPLEHLGGMAPVIQPPANSPLVDHIPVSTEGLCDGSLVTDQRGAERPRGVGCDVGAVEQEPLTSSGFVVDSSADGRDTSVGDGVCQTADGRCTLRAAIDEANADPGHDEIQIQHGRTIELSLNGRRENANATGDLDVHGDLTIVGNGATVDGDGIDRVLDHHSGVVDLHDLTITGGYVDSFTVHEELEWEQYLENGGNGVRSAAPLTIADTTIEHNAGDNYAGHIFTDFTHGGAVATTSDLAIVRSVLRNNDAPWGAALWAWTDHTVEVVDSTITGNRAFEFFEDNPAAPTNDYAIYTPVGQIEIIRTEVVDNEAGGAFRADVVEDSTISRNQGPGLVVEPGAEMTRMVLEENTGVGVIGVSGTTISQSLVRNNGSTEVSGPVLIERSTLVDENSVVSTMITNATVRSSTIAFTGRLTFIAAHISGSVLLRLPGATEAPCSLTQPPTSGGWNVASFTGCGFTGTGDLEGVDPLLGSLGDNGGSTFTMLPAAGSPVIDHIPLGTAGLCDGTAPTDQRGFPRPVGTGCDVGAVEAG